MRRNTQWLYSVEAPRLPPLGLAVTLTVKDCPPDSDTWHSMRRAWVRRVERLGVVGLHWVTEWQRRGVPHLHCALMFDADPSDIPYLVTRVRDAWLAVAGDYGARRFGQHVLPITDPVGWFQYVSKHASRGVHHYQRSRESMPPAWRGRTGRMWGVVGTWPTRASLRLELDRPGWFAFRRIVRRWRLADARASGDRSRVRAARWMLRADCREASEVRGVSEWIGLDQATAIALHLGACGHQVTQV